MRIVRQCGVKGDILSHYDDEKMSVHSTDYNVFDCDDGDGCNTGNTSEKIMYSLLTVAFSNLLVMLVH